MAVCYRDLLGRGRRIGDRAQAVLFLIVLSQKQQRDYRCVKRFSCWKKTTGVRDSLDAERLQVHLKLLRDRTTAHIVGNVVLEQTQPLSRSWIFLILDQYYLSDGCYLDPRRGSFGPIRIMITCVLDRSMAIARSSHPVVT